MIEQYNYSGNAFKPDLGSRVSQKRVSALAGGICLNGQTQPECGMGGRDYMSRVVEAFAEVYTKFKLHFYREIFGTFSSREATLTTVETFCMEVIYSMGRPTINEFAAFIQISPQNAAYKINSLIKKGYVQKIRSTKDKREYYLSVTKKYVEYYNISDSYLYQVLRRLENRLDEDEKKGLIKVLDLLSDELMPEVPPYRHMGMDEVRVPEEEES